MISKSIVHRFIPLLHGSQIVLKSCLQKLVFGPSILDVICDVPNTVVFEKITLRKISYVWVSRLENSYHYNNKCALHSLLF